VGAPLESLRLDRFDRDAGVCGYRVHGRLRKMARPAQSRLTGKQKLAAQFLISGRCLVVLFISTNILADNIRGTSLSVLEGYCEPGSQSRNQLHRTNLYFFLIAICANGWSNAVNLTDGLDGFSKSA